MRLTVRTCFDFLRGHKRNRETAFSELTEPEEDWLNRVVTQPDSGGVESAAAARQLVQRVLEQLSPPARLVITLLEIEGMSVTACLTGLFVALVNGPRFLGPGGNEKKCLAQAGSGDKYM